MIFYFFHKKFKINILSINVATKLYLKFYNTLIFSLLKVHPFGEDLGRATYLKKYF